jgi:hypothetical protein
MAALRISGAAPAQAMMHAIYSVHVFINFEASSKPPLDKLEASAYVYSYNILGGG